jgi:chemotaxis protein MotC
MRTIAHLAAIPLIALLAWPAAADEGASRGGVLLKIGEALLGVVQPPAALAPMMADPPGAPPPEAAAPPTVILPPALATPRFAAIVPKPRLRPPMSPVAGAETPAQEAGGPPPAAIDPVVTAAIDPASASEEPSLSDGGSVAGPVQPPTPAHTADIVLPANGAVTATETDTLLGDPTITLPIATPPAPQPPAPQVDWWSRPSARETSAEPAPPESTEQPYQLIRRLQALQDQTAQGSVEALAAQRALITTITRTFAEASPSVWQEPRNAVAAVAFVLSGGAPAILKTMSTLDPKPAVDERLITGVLAYAEGREGDATAALGPVDAITLPATIAAQVAMAQSALAARTDAALAMRLLALARLLAPGTLVEEAAIRRQIFVADQLRDEAAVQSLARQYLDRFRHSVYAGNFRDRFAAALSHIEFVNDPAQFSRLDDMLASVEADARAELYLTIALAGVVNGKFNAARLAATRAMGLTPSESAGQMRARLYRAAVHVAAAKTFDAAIADFAGVNRVLLSPSDRTLADAVRYAIDAVKSGTEAKAVAANVVPEPDSSPPPAVVARAATVLKTIDSLLGPDLR